MDIKAISVIQWLRSRYGVAVFSTVIHLHVCGPTSEIRGGRLV